MGPFRVPEGIKIHFVNSETYCKFLNNTIFKQWLNRKPTSCKNAIIFMLDNAPSHAFKYTILWLAQKGFKDSRVMVWPPVSLDLNQIENYWSLLKQDIYKEKGSNIHP